MIGLHEAKGDPLEKENEIKNKPLRFAAYKQLLWWKGSRKEAGEFSHRLFCEELDITQKQMDSMFCIIKAKKIDKTNIDTNHSLFSSKS